MTGQGPVRQPPLVFLASFICLMILRLSLSQSGRAFLPSYTRRPSKVEMAIAASLHACGPAWRTCPHISRLRRRPDSRDRPAAACSPRRQSGTCATRWPSAWALCPCLTRVDAPRGWPCLGVDPSQSSHTSLLPAVCWGLSAVGSPCGCAGCRPRRTTRKQSPPARAAVAAARPRRRSACTVQSLHTSLCTWWELAQQRRGAGRGGGGRLQAQYGALDAMRWPDGGTCRSPRNSGASEQLGAPRSGERRGGYAADKARRQAETARGWQLPGGCSQMRWASETPDRAGNRALLVTPPPRAQR